MCQNVTDVEGVGALPVSSIDSCEHAQQTQTDRQNPIKTATITMTAKTVISTLLEAAGLLDPLDGRARTRSQYDMPSSLDWSHENMSTALHPSAQITAQVAPSGIRGRHVEPTTPNPAVTFHTRQSPVLPSISAAAEPSALLLLELLAGCFIAVPLSIGRTSPVQAGCGRRAQRRPTNRECHLGSTAEHHLP